MNNNLVKVITAVSIIIPLAVAVLLFMPSKIELFGDWTYKLPHFNAIINSLTSLFLILSFYMIKFKKNLKAHQNLNTASFILGAIFLVSYIIYHSSVESTSYQGEQRFIYFFFLISHILLSIIVIPLVLTSYTRAISSEFISHKKISKITCPVWIYVAVTGVIVYLMISPYYV